MNKLLTTLLFFSLTYFIQAEKASTFETAITDSTGKVYKVIGTDKGLQIQGLEDKIVFLEFFGHKCPPCLASVPHLIDIQKKYQDKLAIVAIEVQGYNTKEVAAFAKKRGINYYTVSAETATALVDYIQQRAQWEGSIPFLVALDTKGEVQYVKSGLLSEPRLEEMMTTILALTK
ncbi:MAG: TlpA disulfide reductase family protein [Sulfurovum sp.]|nr:TlpA disulfide reductase family protein [Sulfurovum sp.]